MTDPLDGRTFEQLAGDLDFPSVCLGSFEIAGGRVAWEAAFPKLLRADRGLVLRALHVPLLCATAGGRHRWEASKQHASVVPLMTSAEHRDWIDSRLVYVGDSSLLPVVLDALVTCPEPIQEDCLSSSAFIGVGLDSNGWTSPSHFIDKEGRQRQRVVVLGPNTNERTVRHECAHCWLAPIVRQEETRPVLSEQGRLALRALAARDGWLAPVDASFAREERICDALALLWSEA